MVTVDGLMMQKNGLEGSRESRGRYSCATDGRARVEIKIFNFIIYNISADQDSLIFIG